MKNSSTWIVFTIQEEKFALPAGRVEEIVWESPVDFLPLVPDCIQGLLVWHGEPYCVLDPAPLMGLHRQESFLYLLLRHESCACLQISSIVAVYDFQTQACPLERHDLDMEFCHASVTFEDAVFPVIDLDALLARVAEDVSDAG